MPDEAPDVIQDQPEVDAPTDQVDQADAPDKPEYFSDHFDPATLPDELRPAYQQLRGDYTRKTQEIGSRNRDQILQQALQDQNFQRQAFEAWGVEVPQEAEYEEGDYVDPDVEELRRDLAELKQWKAGQEQVSSQRRLADDITEQIEDLEGSLGREFDKKRSDFFGNLALQYLDEQGRPNVRAAYEDWAEQMSEERKSWASTKRQARPAPSGQSGSKQVNLNNDQERLQALADAYTEAELAGE